MKKTIFHKTGETILIKLLPIPIQKNIENTIANEMVKAACS